MKKIIALLLALILVFSFAACGSSTDDKNADSDKQEATDNTENKDKEDSKDSEDASVLGDAEIQVFIAASLENAFIDIIDLYNQTQPNVKVTYTADSSGTLLTQIEEGYECDIFFSAATKQVKTLDETDGLMVEGSRVDLLCNKVCLITWKGSGTSVTGFDNIKEASSMALADGSVPVGKYTRQLLVNMGYIDAADDVSAITTDEVASALGVEINECGNVSKVKEAVKEGSNEIGTVYKSDAYSVIDYVDILEEADTSLTGDIIYPMCRVKNAQADDSQTAAAEDFFTFLQSDEVMEIFQQYMFVPYEG